MRVGRVTGALQCLKGRRVEMEVKEMVQSVLSSAAHHQRGRGNVEGNWYDGELKGEMQVWIQKKGKQYYPTNPFRQKGEVRERAVKGSQVICALERFMKGKNIGLEVRKGRYQEYYSPNPVLGIKTKSEFQSYKCYTLIVRRVFYRSLST